MLKSLNLWKHKFKKELILALVKRKVLILNLDLLFHI